MNNVIEIEDLTKEFDGLVAVDHVTLNVKAGEVFGFLGPNGAGKTTITKVGERCVCMANQWLIG